MIASYASDNYSLGNLIVPSNIFIEYGEMKYVEYCTTKMTDAIIVTLTYDNSTKKVSIQTNNSNVGGIVFGII